MSSSKFNVWNYYFAGSRINRPRSEENVTPHSITHAQQQTEENAQQNVSFLSADAVLARRRCTSGDDVTSGSRHVGWVGGL